MDTYHQQLLLEYLGFPPGELDGKPGPRTRQACIAFQKAYGLTADGVCGVHTEKALRGAVAGTMDPIKSSFDELIEATLGADDTNVGSKTGTFWDSVRYFTREEFRCTCPRCGGFPVEPVEKLVMLLEQLRQEEGVPGIISSGVRCDEHNREVGGVANSRHRLGWAADICFRGKDPDEVVRRAQRHPECAYTYSITSGGTPTGYVHIDVVL